MEKYLVGKKSKDIETGIIFMPYVIKETISIISEPSFEEAKKEVIAVNRERQIDCILEDKEFVAYTLEETETYKKYKDAYFKPKMALKARYTTTYITQKK